MADDYVPGTADDEYDYTKDDKDVTNPIASSGKAVDIGEDEGFDPNFRQDVTAEQIEKGSFRFVEPGVYGPSNPLYIKSVKWHNEGKPVFNKWYVKNPNGDVHVAMCDTKRVDVTFAVPGDENKTIRDFFYIPINPNQLESFEFGFSDEETAKKKKRDEGGFWAKKLKYFIARLGYQSDSQGRVPPEAGQPAKWLRYPGTTFHRYIGMEVEVQRPMKPRPGVKPPEGPQKVYNQIKMFSYLYIEPPSDVKVAQMQAQVARERASQPAIHEPAKLIEKPAEPVTEPVQDDPSDTAKPVKGKPKKHAAAQA